MNTEKDYWYSGLGFAITGESPIQKGIEMFKTSKATSLIEKDYEILYCLDFGSKIDTHKYVSKTEQRSANCDDKGCKIFSVRRLSDNIIFSIDDKIDAPNNTKNRAITSFKILDSNTKLRCDVASRISDLFKENGINTQIISVSTLHDNLPQFLLHEIQKVVEPIPLFKSSDGKDIYENDNFYLLFTAPNGIGDYHVTRARKDLLPFRSYQETFSTEEAARTFIVMNKPLLSLNDLLSVWDITRDKTLEKDKEYYKEAPLFKKFERLAKELINSNK